MLVDYFVIVGGRWAIFKPLLWADTTEAEAGFREQGLEVVGAVDAVVLRIEVLVDGVVDFIPEGGGDPIFTHEPQGEWFFRKDNETWHPVIQKKEWRQFYGMSSQVANDKHNGGLQKYRAAEGKVVTVPYRGTVVDTMDDILGGLRSTCTYIGARQIKDLTKCATFVRVNTQYNKVYENA